MPILSTFGAGSFAGINNASSSGGAAAVIGRYFYSTTDFLWSTLANWFGNSGHTSAATNYPTDAVHVVIHSNCTAVIDYGSPEVVQPIDISVANGCTLTVTATSPTSIGCNILNVGPGDAGTLTLDGNVTYTGA